MAIVMPLAHQRGGAEKTLSHLVEFGRDLGIRWSVLFLEDGPMAAATRELGVPALVFEAGRLRHPHRYIRTVGRIASFARQRGVDALLGWMTKGQIYSGAAAAVSGITSIWYQHGVPSSRDLLERVATGLPARGILACSRNVAAAQGMLRPRRRVEVVYPGVDLRLFDSGPLSSSPDARVLLGLPAEGPLIGAFGRLQRWKGFHTVLEAMKLLVASHPDATCVFVGGRHDLEPAYEAWLRNRSAALGLDSHVRFAGFQENVEDWMKAMDIVVHTAVGEPFGMVVAEAMALGKPLVASDARGPRELICTEVDGLLTPEGDALAVAGAIRRYLEDPALTRRIGDAARVRAASFGVDRYCQTLVSHVLEFVGDRDGPRKPPTPGG